MIPSKVVHEPYFGNHCTSNDTSKHHRSVTPSQRCFVSLDFTSLKRSASTPAHPFHVLSHLSRLCQLWMFAVQRRQSFNESWWVSFFLLVFYVDLLNSNCHYNKGVGVWRGSSIIQQHSQKRFLFSFSFFFFCDYKKKKKEGKCKGKWKK